MTEMEEFRVINKEYNRLVKEYDEHDCQPPKAWWESWKALEQKMQAWRRKYTPWDPDAN